MGSKKQEFRHGREMKGVPQMIVMVTSRTNIIDESRRARSPRGMLSKQQVEVMLLSDDLTTSERLFIVLLEKLGLN